MEVLASDSVSDLLNQARAKLKAQFGVELSAHPDACVIHSQRLLRDLATSDSLEQLLQEGDVLELRSLAGVLRNRSRVVDSSESRKRLLPLRGKTSLRSAMKANSIKAIDQIAAAVASAPPGLPACRLGLFVIAPMKGEHLSPPVRFRLQRVSLAIRLLPYDETQVTETAVGPEFAWEGATRFKHVDHTRSGLIFLVLVYDEPPLGNRTIIGRAYISLEDAMDTPGVSVVRWIRVDRVGETPVNDSDAQGNGRLLVSVCFHPKVSKGPTVQRLLATAAHADADATSSADRTKLDTKTSSFFRSFWNRRGRGSELLAADATTLHQEQSLHRAKGVFSISLRGIHLCGPQCSKIAGHTTLSFPDFSPVVIVRFDDSEHEIRSSASDCDAIAFDHEWSVYSCYSSLAIEVYRKGSLGAGSNTKWLKSDNVPACEVGALAVSCFDVQERAAASWTFDPLPVILGPGKNPPQPGFLWYPLMQDDEEIGLVHLAANYTEDLAGIASIEESADLTYVPPDERTFDAAIIQRNFERLDELYGVVKEMKGRWDDILDWKSPARTVTFWSGVNLCFFVIPPAHFPLVLVIFIVVLLLSTFASFMRGGTHKRWIEHNPTVSRLTMFRPIGTLRVAPLRASHLCSLISPEDHPDTVVRIFYEPNFKKIPVHQFAETECARRTRNPEWTNSHRSSSRDDFLQANTARLKGLFRHLQEYASNTEERDTVESWPRADGGVDTSSFRFSMLQPVEVDDSTEEEMIVDWHRAPGAIRFDVIQDGIVHQNPLIGRVRIPLRSLVDDEAKGGPQKEIEITVPLVLPVRHSLSSSPTHAEAPKGTATLTIRMQLLLRDPNERVTLQETLASEALYESTELEAERELSWVAKFHKAKDVAKNIQLTLGAICSTMEKLKNLFLWVHPLKTLLVLVSALVSGIVFYLVPMKFFVLFATTKAVTRKFHKSVDKDFIRFRNFLVTIPSDLDMKNVSAVSFKITAIYRGKNQDFLRAKEHTEAEAKLKAQWSGMVIRQGHSWLHGWHDRYCAVRGSRLEFWHSIADAKSGLPPRKSYCVSNWIGACSRADIPNLPKDCFPIAVLDVSRSLLTMAPRERRRIICLKSEDDLQGFTEAVRTHGEQLEGLDGDNSITKD